MVTKNFYSAIRALRLEDDEPTELPNSPRFRVFEEKAISLLGRLLNPDAQAMAKMIEDVPRVWRMTDRIRGIALSKDKFRLIFRRDFLTTFQVWIRMRNIPVNHFTSETMAKVIGEVKLIAYDPKVSHMLKIRC
ncbi:unnamed protein product [Arabis nemorensis]|uniref:DUF4283 domain-containing protein n=1 Tax=Arabis nemorensis TaxID=586526 RepID=A0A565CV95_9BRAS|nr:unnamed protein product [Arabis nemorensis]